MKIALSKVEWTQNVFISKGDGGKSLAPNPARGIRLWYLGSGVLIEEEGRPDKFVPLSNVLAMEADERLSAEEWGGATTWSPEAVRARLEKHGAPRLTGTTVSADLATEAGTEAVAPFSDIKRGPGRPKKV